MAAKHATSRKFREALLTQGPRLLAQNRPSAASQGLPANPSEIGKRGSSFEWNLTTLHTRGLYRMGPSFPYGGTPSGMKTRDWSYAADARRTWPVSIRGHDFDAYLSGSKDLSRGAGSPDYALSLGADIPEALLGAASLSLSADIGRDMRTGTYRSLSLQSVRDWRWEGPGADFQLGISGYWDDAGRQGEGGIWIQSDREFGLAHGHTARLSLLAEADQERPWRDRISAPVMYVDDISKADPVHFRGPDFREPLPRTGPFAYDLYALHTGETGLSMRAPQSSFALRPSLNFGLRMPAGWQGYAELGYGLVFYPEYAWDRVPWPDAWEADSASLAGLALNRADGRLYAALLTKEGLGYRESYGSAPLERRKMRRFDRKAEIEFRAWRDLAQGYSLAFQARAAFASTNLPALSPAISQPWQWGLALIVSHASAW